MKMLLELFLTFAKIGLFTFGGGYAMIAVVEDTCVGQKKWITHEEMMELIVLAESTPGPIAINCATYVGYKEKGVWGAIAATVGMVLPSLAIIYAISMFLNRFLEIGIIANAFRGIKVGVGVIIINAGVKLLKDVPKQGLPRVILLCALAAMLLINVFALDFSTVWLLVTAGVAGFAAYRVKGGAGK
ncbi:MAG: chromate transporter [Oscillospiraceae bacterium]|nr:chromate transporter [Oscillospiraceae bacterium]